MSWTTDLTHEITSGTYEITVVGVLGPVLRAAMEPLVATASGPCTTLRTALGRGSDLADLVAALDARGLEVTHAALRRRPSRAARTHPVDAHRRSAEKPFTPAG